jgi:hypothetical protein
MTDINWDPNQQFEKETKAVCRGFLKAVYSGFSDNYLSFYPELDFLETLSIEQLQFLNQQTFSNKTNWSKKQHIHWFLSQQINEIRYEIISDTLLSEYIRRMIKNDAKYYADIALEESHIYDIEDRYQRERQLLFQCYLSLCEKEKEKGSNNPPSLLFQK